MIRRIIVLAAAAWVLMASSVFAQSEDPLQLTVIAGKPTELQFSPSILWIPLDTGVLLTVTNDGALPHSFVINELGINLPVSPGETKETHIRVPAGAYTFACDVPGHEEAGMTGTLVAEERTAARTKTPESDAIVSATPLVGPSPADAAVYAGRMHAVHAIFVTMLMPFTHFPELNDVGLRLSFAAPELWQMLSEYVWNLQPPAPYAERHAAIARSLEELAIAGREFREAAIEDDASRAAMALLAIQEKGALTRDDLENLLHDLHLQPATPLPLQNSTTFSSNEESEQGSTEQHFSGSGDDVRDIRLEVGLLRLTATYEGDSNFIVWLYGPGGYRDLLINEIGSYRGTVAAPIDQPGIYTLAIESDGTWDVVVRQT
ncbi:MAG: hypothetical protein C4346_06975 [Chloroflexota bacterium]